MPRKPRLRGLLDWQLLLALLVGLVGAIITVAAFVFVKDAGIAAGVSAFGGSLLSIAISGLFWSWATRDETTKTLSNAVAETFAQKPEFVTKYFRPDRVLEFLHNNLTATTADADLAAAVVGDLLSPFIGAEKTRIRTSQWYGTTLEYCRPGEGAADGSDAPIWRVVEDLCFDERNTPVLAEGSVVAAFTFEESALEKWFADPTCMYRSIAHVPSGIEGAEAREAWADQHLECTLQLGGNKVSIDKSVSLRTDDVRAWEVVFRIGKGNEAALELLADASTAVPSKPVRVTLRGVMTLSAKRHLYTAYLAYPTQDPHIEFQIAGPVRGLEWATFYNRSTKGDAQVIPIDVGENRKHVKIRLATDRWVFPMSGASFSWTMEAEGCTHASAAPESTPPVSEK